MDLPEIREKIDHIDSELLRLFGERLDLATEVARAKQATGKAIFDPAREREKLRSLVSRAPREREPEVIALFSLLMSMNKVEQQHFLAAANPASRSRLARASWVSLDTPFPSTATVACQGVEGAYSQLAATRLFKVPAITYFNTFEGVMRAVRDGLTDFGVLPIENSTAGSVNAVYDLLSDYRFFIVRSLRLKIDHNLLARPGVRREDIREVISHEQALAQCADYLDRLGVQADTCENTARAAEIVANSDRRDLAALSSRACAELYGLDVIEPDVQDSDNNYTRFVVISRVPQVYPGAERTSLRLTLPHVPGALYRALERFYALDINVVKLESRPIPGHDFRFMFYFDIECPVASDAFARLMDSLDDVCDQLTYYGSYQEII